MQTRELATDGKTAVDVLAQELRAALARSGLSQLEVERRTEIPDSTLARYFKGTIQTPKPSVLAKLALVLNVSYDYLMVLANHPLSADPVSADEAQTLELLRAYPWAAQMLRDLAALRPEGRAAVLALVRTLRTHEGIDPQ